MIVFFFFLTINRYEYVLFTINRYEYVLKKQTSNYKKSIQYSLHLKVFDTQNVTKYYYVNTLL